jgi:hypothetical protein
VEALRWNEDHSVLRIATDGSRGKARGSDFLLWVTLGFVGLLGTSPFLAGTVGGIVIVVVFVVPALGVLAFRRWREYPYLECNDVGIVMYKSYWTRHIAWTDIKGFTDRTYSSPGASWVWLLCVYVRKGLRGRVDCAVATTSRSEARAIIAAIRPFEEAHGLL